MLTKFQQYIAARNLTQAEISRDTGISPSPLNLFAKGRHNWNRAILKKLVVYLRCSPGEILDWESWIEKADIKNAEKAPIIDPNTITEDITRNDIEAP